MTLPTLYFLTVKWYRYTYEIYEQHQCQEKGCFKTDEELIHTVDIRSGNIRKAQDEVSKFIEDFKKDHVHVHVEWLEPHFQNYEQITVIKVPEADATLYGAEEMIETLAQLGGFKVTKYLDDEGYFLGYAMEVAE